MRPRFFVLIPIHNRCAVTSRCLEQLRTQEIDRLVVVIVNDGSTDGTGEMLRGFRGLDLEIVEGDGSLWWGGAVEAGMRRIDAMAQDDDRVLILNDDVELPERMFARLETALAEAGPGTMLGCAQRDLDGLHPGYIGYRIDYQRQRIELVLTGERTGRIVDVDALAGRGVFFTVRLMRAIGYVDAAHFPHYWGDIEYTARARDMGYRVACVTDLKIATSFKPSDGKVLSSGWRQRFLSPVSSRNIRQRLLFWVLRGPGGPRPMAGVRYALLQATGVLRRALGVDAGRDV